MTKEEAAKVLKLERDSWRENPKLKVDQRLYDAIDVAIKALEQTRWIPVSERLPEKEGRYLAYIVDPYKFCYIMPCDYYYINTPKYRLAHCWSPVDECASDNVVAWMPSPEPYRKESEGNTQ